MFFGAMTFARFSQQFSSSFFRLFAGNARLKQYSEAIRLDPKSARYFAKHRLTKSKRL
jgi:hypothetical protein